jgi:hypothetical protein
LLVVGIQVGAGADDLSTRAQFFTGTDATLRSMFGRPPRRKLGPRYDLWASIVAFIFAGAAFIAVAMWSLSLVD